MRFVMDTITIRAVIIGKLKNLRIAKLNAIRYASTCRIYPRQMTVEWFCESTTYQEALQSVMDACIDPIELEHAEVDLHYIG